MSIHVSTNKFMDVKFIAQGLDPEHSHPIGGIIIDALNQDEYNTFSAFVAFASTGGIENIKDQLVAFKNRGGNIRLYIGIDLHGTSKEALYKLIELNLPTYIVFSPNEIVYHPKVYTFEGDNRNMIIVGSSNLTTSGLFQNIEASVCFSYAEEDEQGRELVSDIYDHFNTLLSRESTCCQELNVDIIDLLVRNKVVLSESESRSISNKLASDNTSVPTSDNEELLNAFKKIKISRPPKGHKKTIKQEIIIPDINATVDSHVVHNISEIAVNSMWIETGQMTGASRNILDLSKKGKRDNINKFGSVEFFGLEKDAVDKSLDIDIIYNDRIYRENHIFYAHRNSNWRIQLKGVTDDGFKLTDISRPQFGHRGGFQNRVLIFERTEVANRYILHIAEQDEIDKLKEISQDWAYGGHGAGRAYGIT